MDLDRRKAELLSRDYIRQFGRFDGVEVVFKIEERPEGWVVGVKPANSYLRKHRPDLSMPLFVDRADGKVHLVPTGGTNLLIAQLRGTV